MAITGVTESEYRQYLEHGGDLTFEIDGADIDSTGGFEDSPLIKPHLGAGFELRPTPVQEGSQEEAQLSLYGDSWTRVVAHTYKKGGSIIYRKLGNGRYEAKAHIPPES